MERGGRWKEEEGRVQRGGGGECILVDRLIDTIENLLPEATRSIHPSPHPHSYLIQSSKRNEAKESKTNRAVA